MRSWENLDRRSLLLGAGGFGGGVLFAPVAAAEASLDVVIHPGVGIQEMDADSLASVFLTRQRHWPGGQRIVPFNFPPKTSPRVTFDQVVLGMDPDEVARYWIDRRVRGGERPPRQVPSASLMMKVVSRLEGAIGYVPSGSDESGVRVVARVRGDRVTKP